MVYTIFDIETDGLMPEVSKIHCLSYGVYNSGKLLYKGSLTKIEKIKHFLKTQEKLVGHNIIRYDVPVLEKLLNIKIKALLIDTLGISYGLYPKEQFKHGLEAWGERLGFEKPLITDWENLSTEEYVNRCESDVEINQRLFTHQMNYLSKIYSQNEEKIMTYISYLNFKLDCLREQEEEKISLNIPLINESIGKLEEGINIKTTILSDAMPKIIKKKAPKKIYKADGTLSALGLKWKNLLDEENIEYNEVAIYEKGNPGSHVQLKSWLFELGWKPMTFKVSKATGKKVPQVSLPFGGGLCNSITSMFAEYPFLQSLKGLYKAQHRLGIFKSYLSSADKNNMVYSNAHGFSNTLRLLHSKPIVNLPGADKFYGKEIRGSLTVPDNSYLMCGSDISGLEDNTKQHYIYKYDPDYVTQMRVPGFDPHIDIAVLSKLISKEDEIFYKLIEKRKHEERDNFKFNTEEEKEKYSWIKKQRIKAKTVNFSATYGAGPPKIAETLKCKLKEAEALHSTYWKRNKAVKKIARAAKIKSVNGQLWVYNETSKFWYFLRAKKDIFSTLNQSTGVFIFDSWLRECRFELNKLKINVSLQYHDEFLFKFKKMYKDSVEKILQDSMDKINDKKLLNVNINIDTQFGKNYADVH